jgi:hypothetical protein
MDIMGGHIDDSAQAVNFAISVNYIGRLCIIPICLNNLR